MMMFNNVTLRDVWKRPSRGKKKNLETFTAYLPVKKTHNMYLGLSIIIASF
jgi:hypothetical protein